jgi:hypothetical protein
MGSDDPRHPYSTRCELMLDVTLRTLESDPDLKLCEGLRLIDATHRAISRLAPEAVPSFEAYDLPRLRKILMERFGVSELPGGPVN